MGHATELEKWIGGVMLGVQFVLILVADAAVAMLAPPLAAAFPLAWATLKNAQTVRFGRHRRFRAYLVIAVVASIAAAAFVLGGNDPSLKLRIIQALFADVAICGLAWRIAIDAHTRRHFRSAS